METIELWAQKKDGVWVMLDYEGDLAYNYQTNDLQNPDVKKANYSQAIKLPKTKTNLDVFGNIDIPEIKSDMPYRKIPVRGYWSGITIIDESGYAIVNSIDKTINIQILSGAATFFDLVKSIPFKNLDLGEFKREFSIDNPIQEKFFIPFIYPFKLNSVNVSLYINYLNGYFGVPFIKMTETLQYLFSQIGYTLDIQKTNTKEYVLSVNSIVEIERDFSVYDFNFWIKWDGSYFRDENGQVVPATIPLWKTYIPQMKGVLRGTITCNNPDFNFPITDRKIIIYYGDTEYMTFDNLVNTVEIELPVEFEFGNENNNINFEYYPFLGTPPFPINVDLILDISLQFSTDQVGKFVPAGRNINISGNIGFDTYFDFIKLYTSVYGLNFFVDEKNKKVILYNIEMLSKNNAIDLSDYQVFEDDPVSEFHDTEMAQKNYFKFEKNEIDNIEEIDFFSISDETLELEKDFLEISIESGCDKYLPTYPPILILSMPVFLMNEPISYPLVITEENYNTNMKRHIGEIIETINITWGDYNRPTHEVKTVSLSQIINDNYGAYANKIFKDYVKIKRRFIINEQIFNQLTDEPKLIYLQETGNYYILNKIENYTPGKPMTLELIKIS